MAEELELVEDDFGDAFDGRLERIGRQFTIFVNTKYGAGSPRYRFSLAHELGHYFIDDHRQHLERGGRPHGSRANFVSANVAEREADTFAAALLMPNHLFKRQANRKEPELRELKQMASAYGTSILAAAIRLVNVSDYPCAVIVASGDRVDFAFCSEVLLERGTGVIRKNSLVPRESPSAAFRSGKLRGSEEIAEAAISSGVWFPDARCSDFGMYEEVIELRHPARTLSLLVPDGEDPEEDVEEDEHNEDPDE